MADSITVNTSSSLLSSFFVHLIALVILLFYITHKCPICYFVNTRTVTVYTAVHTGLVSIV